MDTIGIRVLHTHSEGKAAHVEQHMIQDDRTATNLTPEQVDLILAKVKAILAEHFPLPPEPEKEAK